MKTLLNYTLTLLSFICTAQNLSEEFVGSWYTYDGNHRLSEHISLSPGAQFRFYEPSTNYNLALFYIKGNYHFNKKSKAGIGYAYLDIDTVFEFDNKPNVHEHRIYEEYNYTYEKGKLSISQRGRLEHRFLDFRTNTEIQNRFRYRISFKYTYNTHFFVTLTEEPFVNFQNQVFHENRFYTGFGFQIIKHSKLQIGYLKQHIRKRNLNRILIGISIQTDHRKTKRQVAYR